MSSPIVIAHRGASGYRPEHTLESYRLAIDLGADFIEPDLVITRDGTLVARHENALAIVDTDGTVIEATTDVASRSDLADRLTTKLIGHRTVRGWFVEDFTIDELKTLRTRERMPDLRSTEFDDLFEIPTFDEILQFVREQSKRIGRPVGVYPETKHPSYFASLGLAMEEQVIDSLERFAFGNADAPVFIQSFEAGNLRRMSGMTRIPLVQLVAAGAPGELGKDHLSGEFLDDRALSKVAEFAQAIGPDKELILPHGPAGQLRSTTRLVSDAHAAGLLVHAWTFRNENRFMAREFQREGERFGDASAEYLRYFALGIDGVFSDFPDTAVAARNAMFKE